MQITRLKGLGEMNAEGLQLQAAIAVISQINPLRGGPIAGGECSAPGDSTADLYLSQPTPISARGLAHLSLEEPHQVSVVAVSKLPGDTAYRLARVGQESGDVLRSLAVDLLPD
jgi:hypothetical protein